MRKTLKNWTKHPLSLLSWPLLCAIACGDSDGTGLGTSSGTETGGDQTTPGTPTTGAGQDEPTISATSMPETTDTSGPETDTSTGSSAPCGDGMIDPDEECDDMLAGNADHLFCTADCTINVCGDGKLLVNWEICDEGPANSDTWGSLCGKNCTPGKKIADDFSALLEAGPLEDGISITESGTALFEKYVVTNTAPGGGIFSPDQHCQGWTSSNAAHEARVGLNAIPLDAPEWPAWKQQQAWIGAASYSCEVKFHLYCLEI